MKRLIGFISLGLVVFTSGCLEPAGGKPGAAFGALLRVQFAGTAAMARETNGSKFKEIAALPASRELLRHALDRLANAPYLFWKDQLPADATSLTNFLRPLLDDLAGSESFLEVLGPASAPQLVVAVQATETRAGMWQSNLKRVVESWKFNKTQPITMEGFTGWEARRQDSAHVVQFLRAGNWVLAGLGPEKLPRLAELARETKARQRPMPALPGVWLRVQADGPGLRPWTPFFTRYALPPVDLKMSFRGTDVRTEAEFLFSGKIDWKSEPWRIPTNAIFDPLISFSVARGVAPLLEMIPGFRELGLKPTPNQVCLWGHSHMHPQTHMTVPVADARAAVKQFAPKFPQFVLSKFDHPMGQFAYLSNRSELVWQSVPFVTPYLKPLFANGGEYLLAAVFPPYGQTNLPPPALFQQLDGKPNLVCYDWESTNERIIHAREMYQLANLINRRVGPGTNYASERWMLAAAPLLENAATEITLNEPNRLSVVRKSTVGFTGFELATLARWVESPGFPWKFEQPPPRPTGRPGAARAATNAPAKDKPTAR